MARRRRFLIWLAILVAVWLVANWPRTPGGIKRWMEWAGYPLSFAFWDNGQLVWFDGWAFAVDIAVLICLIPLAWACAWRPPNKTKPANGPPLPSRSGD